MLKLSHIFKHLPNLSEKILSHLIIKDLSKRPPLALQGPLESLHVLLDIHVPLLQATLILHLQAIVVPLLQDTLVPLLQYFLVPLLQDINVLLHQDILEHLLLILERVPIHLALQSHH